MHFVPNGYVCAKMAQKKAAAMSAAAVRKLGGFEIRFDRASGDECAGSGDSPCAGYGFAPPHRLDRSPPHWIQRDRRELDRAPSARPLCSLARRSAVLARCVL